MADNSASKILMKHPRFPGADPVQTTRGALDQVWSKKGWVEHRSSAAPTAPTTTPALGAASLDAAQGLDQQAKPNAGDSGKKES